MRLKWNWFRFKCNCDWFDSEIENWRGERDFLMWKPNEQPSGKGRCRRRRRRFEAVVRQLWMLSDVVRCVGPRKLTHLLNYKLARSLSLFFFVFRSLALKPQSNFRAISEQSSKLLRNAHWINSFLIKHFLSFTFHWSFQSTFRALSEQSSKLLWNGHWIYST